MGGNKPERALHVQPEKGKESSIGCTQHPTPSLKEELMLSAAETSTRAPTPGCCQPKAQAEKPQNKTQRRAAAAEGRSGCFKPGDVGATRCVTQRDSQTHSSTEAPARQSNHEKQAVLRMATLEKGDTGTPPQHPLPKPIFRVLTRGLSLNRGQEAV